MRRLNRLLLIGWVFVASHFAVITQARAQVDDGVYNPGSDDVVTLAWIETLVGNILEIAIRLIGLGAFIMIIVGSFSYLTSGGDAQKVEQAKQTIGMAVLGLALTIGVWFILVILEEITGAGLLEFNFGLEP